MKNLLIIALLFPFAVNSQYLTSEPTEATNAFFIKAENRDSMMVKISKWCRANSFTIWDSTSKSIKTDYGKVSDIQVKFSFKYGMIDSLRGFLVDAYAIYSQNGYEKRVPINGKNKDRLLLVDALLRNTLSDSVSYAQAPPELLLMAPGTDKIIVTGSKDFYLMRAGRDIKGSVITSLATGIISGLLITSTDKDVRGMGIFLGAAGAIVSLSLFIDAGHALVQAGKAY